MGRRVGISYFLYGVYSEGQPCHERFKNFIIKSQSAFVKASLFQLLSGLQMIASEGHDTIQGQLVELDIPQDSQATFDAINGYYADFKEKTIIWRETLLAQTEWGSEPAEVYTLNPTKKDQFRQVPPSEVVGSQLFEKLSDRHKTYICKLAIAKGREIVPVDMALYRELMGLELIVDKGRRLALTPLGQEVSCFL